MRLRTSDQHPFSAQLCIRMAKSFAKESALAQTSMWPSNATFLDVIQKASTRGSAPDSLGTNVRLVGNGLRGYHYFGEMGPRCGRRPSAFWVNSKKK